MKRTRYTINDQGILVDRDGNALGRVVGITIEAPKGATGDSPSTSASKKTTPLPPNVEKVWAHYVEIFGASRQTLNAQRQRDIKNALKVMLDRYSHDENFTTPESVERRAIDQITAAINGLRVSPHHNGHNEQGTKYLDIRYALRGNSKTGESNEERIDRMAELAVNLGQRHGGSQSASDAKIDRLVDQVRAAIEQRDSETALQRGREAKVELEGMGFTLRRQGARVWVERG